MVTTTIFSMFKKLKQKLSVLSRDMENIKRDPNLTCTDRNYSVEIKSILDGSNNRLGTTEEKIGELEKITIRTTQNKPQREK